MTRTHPRVLAALTVAACGAASPADTSSSGPIVLPGTSSSGSGEILDGDGDGDDDNPEKLDVVSQAFDVAGAGDEAGLDGCDPPDILVVLDRSQSMHRRPNNANPQPTMEGYESTRWWIALEAIKQFAADIGDEPRLGLSAFPSDPGEGCVTLPERVNGSMAYNKGCIGPVTESWLSPTKAAPAKVDAALDPLVVRLCDQTPIAQAMLEATTQLPEATGEEQFAVLVTDGGESCGGDPARAIGDFVQTTGARTFVVAFGLSAVTNFHAALNDMACAGQMSVGFPDGCVEADGRWSAAEPGGEPLYLAAEDGTSLTAALDFVKDEVCCGAICPEG